MKVKISEIRKIVREGLQKYFEDSDRIRRHNDGYGDQYEEGNEPESTLPFYSDPPIGNPGFNNFLKMYHAEKNPKTKEIMKKVALALGVNAKNLGEDVDRVRRHNDGYGDDLEECGDMGPSPEPVHQEEPSVVVIPLEKPMDEVTPPGEEKVVKALKKNSEVDNPWAVSWSIYNKKHNKNK